MVSMYGLKPLLVQNLQKSPILALSKKSEKTVWQGKEDVKKKFNKALNLSPLLLQTIGVTLSLYQIQSVKVCPLNHKCKR